ncbi:hypothetical protein ACS0TY_026340 [Phlomoides rotata]
MDILKQELMKKRHSLAEDVGGKKVFKRSKTEQKHLQRLREEETREAEAKAHHQKKLQQNMIPNHRQTLIQMLKLRNLSPNLPKSLIEEQNIDDPNLPKQEVIRRLCFLKQPVALSGYLCERSFI